MGGGDFEIDVGDAGAADAPVYDSIGLGVDGGFEDGLRQSDHQGFEEIAGACGGVAGRQNTVAVASQNLPAHHLRCAENGGMHGDAAKRRSHGDYRSDAIRHLGCGRARDDAAQAVPHQVDLLAGFLVGLLYGLGEFVLDQEIRALGVHADAGEVRFVADAVDPGAELGQVQIGQQEARNHHHRRSVSGRDAETPIDRGQAQVHHLDADEHLLPDRQGNGMIGGADFRRHYSAGTTQSHWDQFTPGLMILQVIYLTEGPVCCRAPPVAESRCQPSHGFGNGLAPRRDGALASRFRVFRGGVRLGLRA